MKRDRSHYLVDWLHSKARKPLVVRGARQVGKTWLIRDLARVAGRRLVELNFEKRPDFESLFATNDPKEIITYIGASQGAIDPSNTILFLDEIQVAPHLLSKLRWFAEEMEQLPVIAAGSLLDFALADHAFSMPVGRISYMYLEPLSFEEFLEGLERQALREFLKDYQLGKEVPETIHKELTAALKEYLIVGGMPAAVASWGSEKNLQTINQIHFDLLATYRDDFAKYRGRLPINHLENVLSSIPLQLGNKFVYAHVNPQVQTPPLKQALDLMTKARICHQVFTTAANGVPLGAEVNQKFFKVILLDCGLISAELGLSLHQLRSVSELILINSGKLAEQFVGQQLRTLFPPFASPYTHYWQRTEPHANAEIDYLIQHQDQIIPIEVKAGKTGTLKSLHQFMLLKKKQLAVRINSDYPTVSSVQVKPPEAKAENYTLLSLPFYLTGQLPRLIENVREREI